MDRGEVLARSRNARAEPDLRPLLDQFVEGLERRVVRLDHMERVGGQRQNGPQFGHGIARIDLVVALLGHQEERSVGQAHLRAARADRHDVADRARADLHADGLTFVVAVRQLRQGCARREPGSGGRAGDHQQWLVRAKLGGTRLRHRGRRGAHGQQRGERNGTYQAGRFWTRGFRHRSDPSHQVQRIASRTFRRPFLVMLGSSVHVEPVEWRGVS